MRLSKRMGGWDRRGQPGSRPVASRRMCGRARLAVLIAIVGTAARRAGRASRAHPYRSPRPRRRRTTPAATCLSGAARYRAHVVPHGARWAGGWQPDPNFNPSNYGLSRGQGPDGDSLTLEFCRTKNATGCYTLNTAHPIIGSWLTDKYLF